MAGKSGTQRAGVGGEKTGSVATHASGRLAAATAGPAGKNPLLETWTTPFRLPPFDRIEIGHFMPAFDKGFAANRKEIATIARNPAEPTFANTIDALERSGESLDRPATVFFNLAATDTNAEIQALERALAPRFAKHGYARCYRRQPLLGLRLEPGAGLDEGTVVALQHALLLLA